MRERPILFNTPMVLAILDGRKTQTRRVLKNPEYYGCPTGDCPHWDWRKCDEAMSKHSPFGQPGDRLWVRETWSPDHRDFYPNSSMVYRASEPGLDIWVEQCRDHAEGDSDEAHKKRAIEGCACAFRWRPSIHMPRWASRITLEITGVRVERLQEISEEDAKAEGVEAHMDELNRSHFFNPDGHLKAYPTTAFSRLWDSLAKPGATWADNPWVWVIDFKGGSNG